VKQLNHKPGETLECARDPYCRADLDEDPFGRVDVDLQLPCFVDGRIEEGQKALSTGRNQLKHELVELWQVGPDV
jgi:hypothetical protein